jgi:hypothetical protein
MKSRYLRTVTATSERTQWETVKEQLTRELSTLKELERELSLFKVHTEKHTNQIQKSNKVP